MATFLENIPPAKSLVNGLRAIGYSFQTAMADIIDNSITAEAKNIDICSEPSESQGGPYVLILDDGYGMNRRELLNAMTLGSNRDDKVDCEEDLGRFGLGLKSASFSQCRKFFVISKQNGRMHGLAYDLDHIEETNSWELIELSDDEINKLPFVNTSNLNNVEPLSKKDSGTIVLWTDFDKLEVSANNFEKSFRKIIADTMNHVSFVFHRFYDEINIRFNGSKVEKRDPFLTGSTGKSQTGRVTKIPLENEIVTVTPHTLPHANTLTPEEKKLLGNPKSIYDEQGFYIYRNKRLILWGNWMRTEVRSEFYKLARVQVDIPSSLDKIWSLDVKKSSAKIPDKIKDSLRTAVLDSIGKSKRVVSYPGKKENINDNGIWNRIKNDTTKNVSYKINRDAPSVSTLISTLNDDQLKIFNMMLREIENCFPKTSLMLDQANAVNFEEYEEEDEETLIQELKTYLTHVPYEERSEKLQFWLKAAKYKCLEDKADKILEDLYNE